MVVLADAGAHPGAVVIHSQYALVTMGAVVASLRLYQIALFAVTDLLQVFDLLP